MTFIGPLPSQAKTLILAQQVGEAKRITSGKRRRGESSVKLVGDGQEPVADTESKPKARSSLDLPGPIPTGTATAVGLYFEAIVVVETAAARSSGETGCQIGRYEQRAPRFTLAHVHALVGAS
jgi:hypothetical protein